MTKDSKNSDEIEFNELRIYEDIYDIFEEELVDIGRYISFTDRNLDTYSNKIHELHLRVCSEIENLLKIVVHKQFVSQEKIMEEWEKSKATKLGDRLDAYTELKNSLNSSDKRKVESDLFGKPDFRFYLEVARSNFNLHKKAVNFTGGINKSKSLLSEFIPFHGEASEYNIPAWWKAYNKLKHDKIAHYHNCNLGHLIHAIAGLYLLMLYRKHYKNGNARKEDANFLSRHPSANYFGLDIFEKESKFFYTMPHVDISTAMSFITQPTILQESQYEALKATPKTVLDVASDGILDKEARIFFVELDYRQIANIDPRNPPAKVEKHHLIRQKTRYISFVN